MLPLLVGGIVLFLVVVGFYFFLVKLKGSSSPTDEEEELKPTLKEVEESGGCPDAHRRLILEEYEHLLEEAQIKYNGIQNLVKGKKLPPELEEVYKNFLRIYQLINDMKGEIMLYPSSNCKEYFREKFEFYENYLKELYLKLLNGIENK